MFLEVSTDTFIANRDSHNKKSQEVHGSDVRGFSDKSLIWGKWAILENGVSLFLWIHSKDFFEILHNDKGQQLHGTYIKGFPEKIFVWGKWAIFA